MLQGKAGERPITRRGSDSTRGYVFKLKEGKFRLNIGKKFFNLRMVRHWHRLPREVADVPPSELLKAGWVLQRLCLVGGLPATAGGVGIWSISTLPTQPIL